MSNKRKQRAEKLKDFSALSQDIFSLPSEDTYVPPTATAAPEAAETAVVVEKKDEDSLSAIRARVQERAARVGKGLGKEEAAEALAECQIDMKSMRKSQEELDQSKGLMDIEVYRSTSEEIQEALRLSRADAEKIRVEHGTGTVIASGKYLEKAAKAHELNQLLPNEVLPSQRGHARQTMENVLSQALASDLVFDQGHNGDVRGHTPLYLGGKYYGLKSAMKDVVALFNNLKAVQEAIRRAGQQAVQERREEGMKYTHSYEAIKASHEVVSFKQLLENPKRGSAAVVVLPNRGLMFVKCERKGELVIFAVNESRLADIFKREDRRQDGTGQTVWVPERRMQISFKKEDGRPTLEDIGDRMLKEAFINQYLSDKQREEDRKEFQDLLSIENPILIEQLVSGTSGKCIVRANNWHFKTRDGRSRTADQRVVVVDSDGENVTVLATRKALEEEPALQELTQPMPLKKLLELPKFKVMLRLGEYEESFRETSKLQKDPEIRNLKEPENLKKFFSKEAGKYFLHLMIDRNHVNVVLEIKEKARKYSVARAIGPVSKQLFGSTETVAFDQMPQEAKAALRNLAQAGKVKMPSWLAIEEAATEISTSEQAAEPETAVQVEKPKRRSRKKASE